MVGWGLAAQRGFPRIAEEEPQTIGNPREVGISDYEDIYRSAFSRGKR